MNPMFRVLKQLTWLTQLGFSLVTPPVLCIGGCWWLQRRFDLGGWIMAVGIVLGIGALASSGYQFYRMVCRDAKKDGKKPPTSFNTHE